jgi:phage shock protein E
MKVPYLLLPLALLLLSCSTDSGTASQSEGLATLTQGPKASPAKVQTIGSQQAKALLDEQPELVILDIRTPGEWATGSLKNALLMDYYAPDFAQRLEALDRDKPYLIYCAVGGRSRDAGKLMQQMGFQKVYDATEGFAGLKRAGLAVK